MSVKVAINGFGRIGHRERRGDQRSRPGRDQRAPAALRQRPRPLPGRSEGRGDTIDIGKGKIKVTAIKNPAELPHKDLGVDIALECTGIFTAKRQGRRSTSKAGAKRVLVSAPADGAD
jgi:glyceraldehyde 3-phosphate dehydrogenase